LFASSRRISAYFSTLLAPSVIAYPVPVSRTYPSCPAAAQLSYPSFTASISISRVIFIPLLTARPRSLSFVVRGCLSSAHVGDTAAASVGRICGRLLHRCVRRSSNCIWFALPAHCQCLCRVPLMCYRVRLAFPFLTPTTCVRLFRSDSCCVMAIRLPHVTSYLLLDCSVFRFNFLRPFPSLLSKDMFLNTQKSKSLPYPWHPFPHPVFSPLCRPYPMVLRYVHLFPRR
jgi:hypothetical protein